MSFISFIWFFLFLQPLGVVLGWLLQLSFSLNITQQSKLFLGILFSIFSTFFTSCLNMDCFLLTHDLRIKFYKVIKFSTLLMSYWLSLKVIYECGDNFQYCTCFKYKAHLCILKLVISLIKGANFIAVFEAICIPSRL